MFLDALIAIFLILIVCAFAFAFVLLADFIEILVDKYFPLEEKDVNLNSECYCGDATAWGHHSSDSCNSPGN